MRIELFFTTGCEKCAEARDSLRLAAQSAGCSIDWKEVDIAEDPNRAVDVGVLSTPAVAIDGELVFARMPTASELTGAIEVHIRKQ